MSASPPASQVLLRALRRGAPGLTRAVLTTLLDPQRRRALASALARFDQGRRPLMTMSPRHPMAPAAVRIERTRSGRGRGAGDAEQLAVTVWFGEGPSLPVPGGLRSRGAMRLGAGVASAAAFAAATTLVSRLGERPGERLLGAAQQPRRLTAPSASQSAPAPARPPIQ